GSDLSETGLRCGDLSDCVPPQASLLLSEGGAASDASGRRPPSDHRIFLRRLHRKAGTRSRPAPTAAPFLLRRRDLCHVRVRRTKLQVRLRAEKSRIPGPVLFQPEDRRAPPSV